MKVFEFLLSGENQTCAVIVGAEDRERAMQLLSEEYDLEGDEEDDEDHELYVYRDSIISEATASEEFVREIFSTDEL